jgi:uncharacterized protein (TIGR00369 family)
MADDTQPLSGDLPRYRRCFVCGEDSPSGIAVTFYVQDGTVRADFVPSEAQMGFPGICHGGVLGALLDEAMGWAPTMETGLFCLTGELRVRYVAPVPIGTPVTVIARADKVGRIYLTSGEIVGRDGTIYARGMGKYIPMSLERTREVARILESDERTLPRHCWVAGEPPS